jgi:hypothetical protein
VEDQECFSQFKTASEKCWVGLRNLVIGGVRRSETPPRNMTPVATNGAHGMYPVFSLLFGLLVEPNRMK